MTVAIADQSQSTQADAKGKWSVKLKELTAGTSTTMTVTGSNKIEIQDVLVGEVWLGSGQSNMAMPVNGAKDSGREAAEAKYPQIRMFREISTGNAAPQADCHGKWLVCAPDTVGTFSATLYFFGREIHQSLNVPVGLINSSAGGTAIESWISAEAQRAEPALKPYLTLVDKEPDLLTKSLEQPMKDDITSAPAGPARQAAQQAARQAAARAAAQAARKEQKKPGTRASSTEEKIDRDGGLGGLFNSKDSSDRSIRHSRNGLVPR